MNSFTIPCLNYQLDADWYDGTTDKVLLVLIGWTSSRKNYENLIGDIVTQSGVNALVFEYSGHGPSRDQIDPTTLRPAQHFLEVITVFDWLKSEKPDLDISVMGTSYGGYMATQLSTYRGFESLVLRAPTIYPPHDFYTVNEDINREFIKLNYRTDPEALATHPFFNRPRIFDGRTLVVVHEKDEQIATQTTDAYIHSYHADTYVAPGMPHSIHEAPEADHGEYRHTIADWLKEHA